MARYIDIDKSVDIGYLSDWYQCSIGDTIPPIWTDEHLEELLNDFILIPNDTPTADVVNVVECSECKYNPNYKRAKNMVWCRKFREDVRSDGFCSYGERKGDK